MDILEKIQSASILDCSRNQDCTTVIIEINGIKFLGHSSLNPKDKDFDSDRVAKKIATSRARIAAFNYFIENAANEEEQFQLRKAKKIENKVLYKYIENQEKFIQEIRHRREMVNSLKQVISE